MHLLGRLRKRNLLECSEEVQNSQPMALTKAITCGAVLSHESLQNLKMSGYADNPATTHDYPSVSSQYNIEIPASLSSKLRPDQMRQLEETLVRKEHDSRKHIVKVSLAFHQTRDSDRGVARMRPSQWKYSALALNRD